MEALIKADKFIKECGPFKVVSISQDRHGVRVEVYPAFPQYGEDWEITRLNSNGGGPSIFTAMSFASRLEKFLNQPYTQEAIDKWEATLHKAVKGSAHQAVRRRSSTHRRAKHLLSDQ